MDNITYTLLKLIAETTPRQGRLIVAIDGRCAAGKTTLAQRLSKVLGCGVIHMDHFFLRPEQRTQERLATPGGNVDHERFLEEVLLPIKTACDISYCPFDCKKQALAEPISIKCGDICIVEGSYSCHPVLAGHYQLRIFLDVSPEEQLRRIFQREGADKAEMFRSKWIPMEERYFSAFNIESVCDIRLSTDRSV
ncbi:MAG: uridine kinase [Oscillospiraceae bacterium]|nr:uridine kinase [Oscillospiraceae bacterium]